jgi:hypothetical protein
LLATGKYIEATGLDEMEADAALEDLAETNPAQLNVFFRSIGMASPADGPRRSVHGGPARLVQSLNWAHFGMLRELEPGEHAKHGTASASAPIKALLATLKKERGGEIAYKGGLYRVIGHGDTTYLRRGGGYEVVPPGEAVPLLQAMAAEVRGQLVRRDALRDAEDSYPAVPPGTRHAAAFDYERDNTRASLDPAFLTKDGTLWFDTHPPMIKQRGVDLDSPLPIATTSYVYWGTRAPDGTISFKQL